MLTLTRPGGPTMVRLLSQLSHLNSSIYDPTYYPYVVKQASNLT